MNRLRPLILITAALFACESEPAKSDDKGKAKTAETKKGEAKPDDKEGGKADAKKDGLHYDISHDKSGVLARSAAALEVNEDIDSENLRELSHHAEKLPSVQKLCKHMKEIGEAEDMDACVTQSEHHLVLIGPELYGEWAECVLKSVDGEAMAFCDRAEAEAEKLLHEKPHGEGLTKDECTKLFDKFEKLAMEDAGDHAAHVEEVLEEVKDDIVVACVDQGTKAEVECVDKSGTLTEVKECASGLL